MRGTRQKGLPRGAVTGPAPREMRLRAERPIWAVATVGSFDMMQVLEESGDMSSSRISEQGVDHMIHWALIIGAAIIGGTATGYFANLLGFHGTELLVACLIGAAGVGVIAYSTTPEDEEEEA
jgi:hypothetical protein